MVISSKQFYMIGKTTKQKNQIENNLEQYIDMLHYTTRKQIPSIKKSGSEILQQQA